MPLRKGKDYIAPMQGTIQPALAFYLRRDALELLDTLVTDELARQGGTTRKQDKAAFLGVDYPGYWRLHNQTWTGRRVKAPNRLIAAVFTHFPDSIPDLFEACEEDR